MVKKMENLADRLQKYNEEITPERFAILLQHRKLRKSYTNNGLDVLTNLQIIKIAYALGYDVVSPHIKKVRNEFNERIKPKIPLEHIIPHQNKKEILEVYKVEGVKLALQTTKLTGLEYTEEKFQYCINQI